MNTKIFVVAYEDRCAGGCKLTPAIITDMREGFATSGKKILTFYCKGCNTGHIANEIIVGELFDKTVVEKEDIEEIEITRDKMP